MIIRRFTSRRTIIVDTKLLIRAWSSQAVTIEFTDKDSVNREYRLEFEEEDLRQMLKKIEDRKEEINKIFIVSKGEKPSGL
jgi:hypothetical protein